MLIYTFFTFYLAVTKKTVGDGEKLLTYLNSVLKVLSGSDIFPRGTKKSEILLTSVIYSYLNYLYLSTAVKRVYIEMTCTFSYSQKSFMVLCTVISLLMRGLVIKKVNDSAI
jgi:hypothetical protein